MDQVDDIKTQHPPAADDAAGATEQAKVPDPNNNDITFFARTNFRNQQRKFGIKRDDRRRHMYLIGKTGMGKSTVLENMIYDDIMAGNGLGLVDPHGDLAEKVLAFVPSWRVNDVIYFNPSDVEYPIAFNVLEQVSETHRHLVASGLLQVFKKLWADSWGPRLEYILMNALLALIDYPGSTLLGVTRILVDKPYRRKVVSRITDPVVRSFWITEYDNYNDKFRNEAIAPIQNKVGQFLSSVIIRNIVGQPKSTIDMRDIMDNRKILIMNLAKGRIGEDNSALLGAMMITKLQIAAMSRVDIPEAQRQDFYLYVDEFQNFATESFANILSEARKYRLCLILAHQYIEQLAEEVRSAVFGNVGTLVAFRVGAEDSEFLSKEFMPEFTEEDLINLTKYDVYMKLMIDGVASSPFSATMLPPVVAAESDVEKVIRVSRERYAKPRQAVEEKIMRWSGVEETHLAASAEEIGPEDPNDKAQLRYQSSVSPQGAGQGGGFRPRFDDRGAGAGAPQSQRVDFRPPRRDAGGAGPRFSGSGGGQGFGGPRRDDRGFDRPRGDRPQRQLPPQIDTRPNPPPRPRPNPPPIGAGQPVVLDAEKDGAPMSLSQALSSKPVFFQGNRKPSAGRQPAAASQVSDLRLGDVPPDAQPPASQPSPQPASVPMRPRDEQSHQNAPRPQQPRPDQPRRDAPRPPRIAAAPESAPSRAAQPSRPQPLPPSPPTPQPLPRPDERPNPPAQLAPAPQPKKPGLAPGQVIRLQP